MSLNLRSFTLKVLRPKYSSSAGGMPVSREISCDHSSKYSSRLFDLLAVAFPELNHVRKPRYEI